MKALRKSRKSKGKNSKKDIRELDSVKPDDTDDLNYEVTSKDDKPIVGSRIMPEHKRPLRDLIFECINKCGMSQQDALKTLEQCASSLRNRLLIEGYIKECGLQSGQWRSDYYLELYLSLIRNHRGVGYISKGWDDPGFRIGEVIKVEESKSQEFKAHLPEIRQFCATNGIVISEVNENNSYDLQLEGLIYSEGFNKDTFINTLDTLTECVEKTRQLGLLL